MRGTSLLTVPADALSTAVDDLRSTPVGWLVSAVRAAAFWVAVALPAAYPPLLTGPGPVDPVALAGLLCLHAAALLVGHVHDGVLGQFDRAG